MGQYESHKSCVQNLEMFMQWNYLQVTNTSQLRQNAICADARLHLFAVTAAVTPAVIHMVAEAQLIS